MFAEELKSWLNSRLDVIIHDEFQGCLNVSDVEMEPLMDQAIVMISDIYRATLVLQMNDGRTKRIKTIAKFEPTVEGFIQIVKDFGFCDTETMMYSKILNKMEELIVSEEISTGSTIFWPQCYYCENNQFLLQDLNEFGYSVPRTDDMLDMNHAKLALTAIGKFHAMGLVLMEQNKLEGITLPSSFYARNHPFSNALFLESSIKLASVIDSDWGQEWEGVGDKLRKAVENVGDKLQHLMASTRGKCDVICHGDFTIRNLLFHYQQDGKTPDSCKLIDFQLSNWGNLALDLTSLLTNSMMPLIREDNLDQLLDVYKQSLTKACSSLGYKGYVPTTYDIRQSYHDLGYLGMISSTFLIPIHLAPKEFDVNEVLVGIKGSQEDKEKKHLRKNIVQNVFKTDFKRYLKQKLL